MKIVSKKVFVGLHDLKIIEENMHGDCQLRNHKTMSHKKVQYLTATSILELLYMDLMGPMQVMNLRGKKYVFVCVDDYSRYTWVDLVCEKSDIFATFEGLRHHLHCEKGVKICKIIRI